MSINKHYDHSDIIVSFCRFCEDNDTFDFANSLLEFHKPGVGLVLLYMSMEGIVFFIITLLIQVCFYSSVIMTGFNCT